MKSCNRWWDDSFWTESVGGGDANLSEPGLIPRDLPRAVEVGSIVLVLMRESMRDVGESIEIGGLCPPDFQSI